MADEVAASVAVLLLFAQFQGRRNLSPSTISKYRTTVQGFFDTLNGNGWTKATASDVEAFLATRNITARGRYHYLSHISVFYRWAIEEGHASQDPTRRIPRPKLAENLPRPVSDSDLALAIATAGPRMKVWLCLGAYSGLRCKEIANVKVEDLHFNSDPPILIVSAPKGQRQRAVPMHPKVAQALRAFGIPKAGFVFTRWDTVQAIQPYTVSHEISKHFTDMGSDATAHQLRHWFASALYGNTKNLRITQEMMGHRDPATTAIYTKLSPSEAAEGVLSL